MKLSFSLLLLCATAAVTVAAVDNSEKDSFVAQSGNIRGNSNNQSHRQEAYWPLDDALVPPRHRDFTLPEQSEARQSSTCATCTDSSAVQFAGNSRDEIFNQLNSEEYRSLIDYALSSGLADSTMNGLRSPDDALNTNYIVFLQLSPPPKLEALQYLDGWTDTPPARYGIITIHRGKASPRDVMQYKVRSLRRCFY